MLHGKSKKSKKKTKQPAENPKQEQPSQIVVQKYLFNEQLELKQGGQNYGSKGQQVIDFMKEFKEAGFTENLNEKGLVMYSDDQYFCR